jgi:integral membrane sensor domain MASE1
MNRERNLHLARVAVLAAVYYGAAKLGLSLAFETPSVSAVWAPTGIALAALVLFGMRLWPGVALGAFLANVGTGVPLLAVFGITAGNTLEALVGAYLLMAVAGFRPTLERVRDVTWFVLLAAITSTAISATIGTTSLLAADEIGAADYGMTLRTWWLGDMFGDLVVAPAIFVAVTHWPYRRAPGRVVEGIALGLLVAGVVALVFTREEPLTFLLVPVAIVVAFRFHQAGAVTLGLLTAAIAVPLTEEMRGPFADYPPDDRLLLAQAFVGVVVLSTLVLAVVIDERRRAEASVRAVATALQESLLPSALPAIPGMDTAVYFRPVGESELVGGDFYEVVEGDDGSVGIAIGDALGKGAIAAAGTALARYTLRAAAMHHPEPSGVLSVLNEAMLSRSADNPCTVAYARIDPGTPGAELTVSIGGHPPPLILRESGEVEAIGTPAPPLGVRRDLGLTDHRTRLALGDALVFYTDGLTDAYAPGRIVSPADLAAALQTCRGAGAEEIADTIRETAVPIQEGQTPRDDILLLVIRLKGARDLGPA